MPPRAQPFGTDFVLPGRILNPNARRKFQLSVASAYSRQWNPRNLEAPWYETWGLIFTDLVADFRRLSVAPQYRLWYLEPDVDSDIGMSDGQQDGILDAQPQIEHEEFKQEIADEDHAIDDGPEDMGDTTFQSVTSDQGEDSGCIPDFCITRKIPIPREPPSHWPGMHRRICYVGIPLLCECKASGPRSRSLAEGLRNAETPMITAHEQLEAQACYLFKIYPLQTSVILVAVTGFWWSYWVADRTAVGDQPMSEPVKVEDESDVDYLEESRDQDGIHSDAPQDVEEENSDSDDELLLRPYEDNAHEGDGNFPFFHPILAPENMVLKEDDWSDFLLIDSPSSNQVLYLIHERLLNIVNTNDYTMG